MVDTQPVSLWITSLFRIHVLYGKIGNVMTQISETAHQNLTASRKPGFNWVVAVAGGGNSYAQVPIATRKSV